jgi:hypothetical protein
VCDAALWVFAQTKSETMQDWTTFKNVVKSFQDKIGLTSF